MAFDAFISHSNNDKTAADAACAILEGAGIRCWIAPRDIRAGGEYGAAIIEAIDQCRVMVLIFSSSANDSRQVHREIERAVSKGVTIVPLRIDDVMPTKSMAYFLGAIHWLDALTPPIERHLQKLAETVKAILKADAAGGNASADDGMNATFMRRADLDTAHRLVVKHPAQRGWLLPALAGGICVVVLASGVWLYRSRVAVPTATPNMVSSPPAPNVASSLPAPKQAEAMGNWAGIWAGVWFVRNGKESTVAITNEGNSFVGTVLWRGMDDSDADQHRADGKLLNCKVSGNAATCDLTWDYTDPGKELKNHATGNLTLDGDHIAAEFHQDEAEPEWRKAPTPTSMHVGAVWQWDLTRKR